MKKGREKECLVFVQANQEGMRRERDGSIYTDAGTP